MTIPDEWKSQFRTALQSTFGVDAPESVTRLTGGLSGAPVLRIVVAGRSYVLRLDPLVDGMEDPRRWTQCLRIAATAGVAPKVHYTHDGVSIVDFVQQDGGAYRSRDRQVLARELGELMSRLHAAPLFPAYVDYLDGLQALIGNVRRLGVLSETELERPLARFAELIEVYGKLEPQVVSSHNDANPRNIVHDGQRLWLVDWLSAFPADRYVDLASIGSFFAREPEKERLMLDAYFGRAATDAEVARLHLARLINHMFYAMIMLTTTGGARPASLRSLDQMQAALGSGEPVLESPAGRAEYAMARLEAMAAGVESAEFARDCALAR